MGRPGLTQNRKFRRLARALGSDALARGSLELLWDTAYEAGNDYLGDADDVELAARWVGEPGVLFKALIDAGGEDCAGFIERDPDRSGFRVHDLFENAPEYVQKRMLREIERNQRGHTISELRREAGKKGRAAQLADKIRTNGVRLPLAVGQVPTNGDTPAPAPAPAPAHVEEPSAAKASVGHLDDSELADPRHAQIRHLIQELYVRKFQVNCPWDGSEGRALDCLLSANPSWTLEQLATMVRNRFASEGITSDRPRKWLSNLGSYAAGPLDRYNKLKGPYSHGNGNRSEQRQASLLASRDAARERIMARRSVDRVS